MLYHESTPIVFDRCYFTKNFRYLNGNRSRSSLTGTTFEMIFFFVFLDKLSSIFTSNQNICKGNVAVSLATKKSNPTGTKFELKFICIYGLFIITSKQIRTFPIEHCWEHYSVEPVNALFKNNNCKHEHICLVSVHLLLCYMRYLCR